MYRLFPLILSLLVSLFGMTVKNSYSKTYLFNIHMEARARVNFPIFVCDLVRVQRGEIKKD